MKHFFTISLCFLALSLSAQETITYPYNPDGNADGSITVPDLQDFLGNYGGAFSPSDILVDGETLVTVLTNLQNSIDSLSALTGGSAGSVLDMPIGTVLPVASEAVPEGWMLCDGSEVGIEDYQALYDLVGTTYGAGDSAFWAQVNYPATTFNIPDLRGRTIIGADNMGSESAGVVSQHPSWLGKSGGAEMHQLTEDEMPSHGHNNENGIGNNNNVNSLRIAFTYSSGVHMVYSNVNTELTGGDQPHNNMQPYIALNYMVKVKAAFDVIEEMQTQLDSLSQVVSNLDSTLSVFTSFFNLGCMDTTSSNYDATANFDDGSCCIDGCTDPAATNFNATATCDNSSCHSLVIGDIYGGGIVFYLDAYGGGLIAAPTDQSTNAEWGCYQTLISGAYGTAIGTGAQNTIDIVNANCSPNLSGYSIAANICDTLTLGGYSDWFLPSKDELSEMYLMSITPPYLGNFSFGGFYWSSSQVDSDNAWLKYFLNGLQSPNPKTSALYVRAIRAF